MKLVLEIIEELIEQVALDGLKQWLIKHFNSKATRVLIVKPHELVSYSI